MIPRLHLIGPLVLTPTQYVGVARAAVRGGVEGVHVRLPQHGAERLLAVVRAIRAACPAAQLFINDRIDVAQLVAGAHLQLGEHGLSVRDARQLLGPDVLIGRSVHSVYGADMAQRAGADYLLAGHVFATESKSGQPARGLDWLRDITTAVDIPVIAIGGINAARVADVLAVGAHGVAVGREVLLADDPAAAANELHHALQRGTRMSETTLEQTITVEMNGVKTEIPAGMTLGGFIDSKGIERRMIAVEYNAEILPRHAYDATTLQDGDRLEIVQMVGGG